MDSDNTKSIRTCPYIIGIAGPSCGGKSTVCDKIIQHLKTLGSKNFEITLISQDRYYYGGDNETNYDLPDAINFEKLVEHVKKLKAFEPIDAPIYDFTVHKPKVETEKIYPFSVIIVEGILILYNEQMRDLFDLKIFVDALEILRYERRTNRDVKERGRDKSEVKQRYLKDVTPSNKFYVEPTENYADVVLKNNVEDKFIGLNMVLDHIEKKLINIK